MSSKVLSSVYLSLFLTFSMTVSTTVAACDDKPCEAAYLAETQQHIANQVRRADSHKVERHAYSKNRERRAYAEFVHKHYMWAKAKLSAL